MNDIQKRRQPVEDFRARCLRSGRRVVKKVLRRHWGYNSIVRSANKIGDGLPVKMRSDWHNFVYRVLYRTVPAGEPKDQVLRRQSFDHVQISENAVDAVLQVRDTAQNIYGEQWNAYSNSLRREVVHTFEKSIGELCSGSGQVDYLEIGSAQGISMGLIASLLRRSKMLGRLVSVDAYFEDGYHEAGVFVRISKTSRNNARRLYDRLGLDVRLIEKTSFVGLTQLLNEGAKFHLIYVDAYHSNLNPTIDFSLAYNLLHAKGIIMIDDHVWPDVASVKHLCDRYGEKIDECWKIAAYRFHSSHT